MQRQVAKLPAGFLQKSPERFPDIGKVALIIGKQYMMLIVQNRNLDCGGAYINAEKCIGIAEKCIGIARDCCFSCEFHVNHPS